VGTPAGLPLMLSVSPPQLPPRPQRSGRPRSLPARREPPRRPAHLAIRAPSPRAHGHLESCQRPRGIGAPHGRYSRLRAAHSPCKISHKMRHVAYNLHPSSHRRCAAPPPPAPASPRWACATRERGLARALNPRERKLIVRGIGAPSARRGTSAIRRRRTRAPTATTTAPVRATTGARDATHAGVGHTGDRHASPHL